MVYEIIIFTERGREGRRERERYRRYAWDKMISNHFTMQDAITSCNHAYYYGNSYG